MIWLMTLIGAQLNVLRGGWPFSAKWAHPLGFGVALVFFIPWWQALLGASAMWAGQQLGGWGAYVGTMIDQYKPHPEVAWIDFTIQKLERWPRLWGTCGMTLRGLQWALPLALVLSTPLPLPAGLLMGPVYLALLNLGVLANSLISLTWPNGKPIARKDIGWLWSEWVWGGLLWFTCFAGVV